MQIGYGVADITPRSPTPLCGFAARGDALFEGVDDPLHARAIAVSDAAGTTVVLVFDLLALGPEIDARIHAALDEMFGRLGVDAHAILCTTHTHSAPAAITLLGCGSIRKPYWDLVVAGAVEAAKGALDALRPARMRCANVTLKGHSYNRRRVLDSGRLSMSMNPGEPVDRCGAVQERALLARFDDDHGKPLAGIVTWAAHAVTVCGPNVTADYPGELLRRLADRFGFPFLFLQGACGNINPVFEEMTRSQMLTNVSRLMEDIGDPEWSEVKDRRPRRRRARHLPSATPGCRKGGRSARSARGWRQSPSAATGPPTR